MRNTPPIISLVSANGAVGDDALAVDHPHHLGLARGDQLAALGGRVGTFHLLEEGTHRGIDSARRRAALLLVDPLQDAWSL